MAWKEMRLQPGLAYAQIRKPALTNEQQGRLAIAWMALWMDGSVLEHDWRLALGYSAAEWAGVRDVYADVLQQPEGEWELPFMREERVRQARVSSQQADIGRRGGLAKASVRQESVANAIGSYDPLANGSDRYEILAKPAPASASASDSKALAPDGAGKRSRKEISYTPEFEVFWGGYSSPRRTGKPQAFREWVAAGGQRIHEQIDLALTQFKRTQQWRDGFEPEPARWLKKRPWEDGPVPQEDPTW